MLYLCVRDLLLYSRSYNAFTTYLTKPLVRFCLVQIAAILEVPQEILTLYGNTQLKLSFSQVPLESRQVQTDLPNLGEFYG